MKKGVLFTTFAATVIGFAVPETAFADSIEPQVSVLPVAVPATKKLDVTLSGANVYAFPDQAVVVSHNPVGNINVDYNVNKFTTFTVWAQAGDRDGTEVDLIGSVHTTAGKVSLSAMGGVYLYPYGQATIYTAAVSASAPIAGFTLRGNAQQYWGGLKTTKLQVELSHPVKIGPVAVDLMVGKAWNDDELAGVNPWYGSVTVPVSDHVSFRASGYVSNGDTGGVVGVSYHF